MIDEKRIPLEDRLKILLSHMTNTKLFADDGPNAQIVRDAITTVRQTVEALENMKSLYDTPIERRRKGACKVYAETIQTARAALRAAYGEDKS